MSSTNKQTYIMDIAEDLFCKHGSKDTTVRLITRKAGINTAMLNYYFRSKENLFLMILERKIRQFNASKKMIRTKNNGVPELFLAHTAIYIELIATHLPFYRLMMTEKLLNENKKAVRRIDLFFDSNIMALKKLIEKGMSEDKIEARDIETILVNVSGVFLYAILKSDAVSFALSDPNKMKLQEHIKSILKSFIVEKK